MGPCTHCIRTLAASSGKRNVTVWLSSVGPSVPSAYSSRDSMRRGQRTFRPDNKDDRHTCCDIGCVALRCPAVSGQKRRNMPHYAATHRIRCELKNLNPRSASRPRVLRPPQLRIRTGLQSVSLPSVSPLAEDQLACCRSVAASGDVSSSYTAQMKSVISSWGDSAYTSLSAQTNAVLSLNDSQCALALFRGACSAFRCRC